MGPLENQPYLVVVNVHEESLKVDDIWMGELRHNPGFAEGRLKGRNEGTVRFQILVMTRS